MRQPSAVAFDAAGNLWVADRGNHRVLRIPTGSLDSIAAAADVVLGQPDFVSAGTNGSLNPVGPAGFNNPRGLAFDGQNSLYVSDFTNARILVFTSPQATGQMAARVLGQPTFLSSGAPATPTAGTLRGPAGLTVSSAGHLYVSVPLEHRVLVYNSVAQAPAGAAADGVLGQAVMTTGIPNINTHPRAGDRGLNTPGDVAVDGEGNIFVADTGNHRVVAYSAGGNAAQRVWGQPDFTRNAPNGVEANSISGAYQIAVDYTTEPFPLYVSDTNNHRVLIWRDSTSFTNGAAADLVIGQPDMTTAVANVDTGAGQSPSPTSLSAPRGIGFDTAGNLFVADAGNNRVVRFPRPLDQVGRITADLVLGQNDLFSSVSAAVSGRSLRSPSDVVVGPFGNVFVADTGNNRVLQFGSSLTNGAAAVRVFGQRDFATGAAPAPVSSETLFQPGGVFVDLFGFLYVADTGANRVLIYPNATDAAETGASASIVIGQPSFGSFGDGRGAAGLDTPRNVATDSSGKIYVSDSGNHRVVFFSEVVSLPIFGAQAIGFLGQSSLNSNPNRANFNSSDGRATAQGMFAPVGLFVDRNSTLYVGDTGNNRVVHFLKPGVAVNGAHFLPGVPVAPGSLISLFGLGFSTESDQATQTPLPRVMAERKVEVTPGLEAPLLFVSPMQINMQVPVDAPPGSQGIAVRRVDTNELLAGGVLAVSEASPGFFTVNQNGAGQILALNENGTQNGPSNPAALGSVVSLYGTGPGPVNPAVASGEVAPSSPLAVTVANPTSDGGTCLTVQPSVCVAVGSTFGEVLYSGLAPGFVGLWQINVRIPEGALTGDAVPIRGIVRGVPSNQPTLAIQ
jgi:uncharacterized protein (TIGR03437 family)